MEKTLCVTCEKPKATLVCGVCESSICKKCAEFIEPNRFAFLSKLPKEFETGTFCHPCFTEKAIPAMENYDQTMEQAKQVSVFFKTQSKETRLIKRLEEPVQVLDCADHDETLLRLAFMAVKADYSVLIDVDIVSEKVRSGAYQTLKWRGVGIPAHVDPAKLNR